jgi:N-acetyl-gamma-glutamylphosphate reductase
LNKEEIRGAFNIANPGCFDTDVLRLCTLDYCHGQKRVW